jgi:hypothetical protein
MQRQVGGMHVQSYNAPMGPQAWDAVINRKFGSFKFMSDADNLEAAQRFHANNPTAPVCFRLHTNDSLSDLNSNTDRALASAEKYRFLGDLLYVEIPINEAFQTGSELSQLAEASMPQARKIHSAGFKPVAFNFSVGNPPRVLGANVNGEIVQSDSDIARIAYAAQVVCGECNGCIGYHGYGIPTAWNDEWLGLRYRRMHSELRDYHGVTARWWLGEAGIDHGIIDGRLGGWRLEEFNLTSGEYAEMVRSNCQEVAKDNYVIAASFFGAGGYYSDNPQQNWTTFEYSDCHDVLDVFTEQYEVMALPDIGSGFQKFIPYLGQPLENELYHFPGTEYETSMAVFENGSAMWTRATNEVVATRSDGAVFHDRGNAGDGVTVWRLY